MELDALDKKNLILFDKDYNRYMLYLKEAKPDALKEFQGYAVKLRERLKSFRQQTHPDVIARQAKIAEYDAKIASLAAATHVLPKDNQDLKPAAQKSAADVSVLNNDDRHRVGRIEGELKTEQKTLAAHDLTVLDSGGGEGSFHQMSKRLHGLFDAIGNKEHPDVKKLAELLSAYDKVLEEKTCRSREHLSEIGKFGDVQSTVMNFINAFAVETYPPQLAAKCVPDEIRSWAASIKEWQKLLDEAVPYFRLVQQWAPIMATDVELGNRVKRFLTERAEQLEQVLAGVLAGWKAEMEQALAVKPGDIAQEVLGNGAAEELDRIQAGLEAARSHIVFDKAFNNVISSESEKTVAILEANIKTIRELVAKTGAEAVANARLPEPVDEPELLKIAQQLITEPYERLIVTRGIRQTTGEVESGAFIYATDYDIFWAAAVHKLADGTYRIWEYSFCYSRKGTPGTTFHAWVMDENWGGAKILKENIDK